MIEIKDLLLNLNDKLLKEVLKVEEIKNTIKTITGIDVDPKKIKFKNHKIFLDIKPIHKNTIILKEKEIFQELEKRMIHKIPKSIK